MHVLWVTLYVCAAMAALGAIGLAISTFTEHAIGAIAAHDRGRGASEVVDNIPQFAPVDAVPADALVAVVRLAAAHAGRHHDAVARTAVVRRLRGDLLRDRLGPVHSADVTS